MLADQGDNRGQTIGVRPQLSWTPDNPEIRQELTIIMESGNEAYGPDTHWIEEREA